jgi:hypothetical protein
MLVICEIRQVVSEVGAKGQQPNLELLIDCRGLQKSPIAACAMPCNAVGCGLCCVCVGSLGRIQAGPRLPRPVVISRGKLARCPVRFGGRSRGSGCPGWPPTIPIARRDWARELVPSTLSISSFPGPRTMLRASPGALDWRVRVGRGFSKVGYLMQTTAAFLYLVSSANSSILVVSSMTCSRTPRIHLPTTCTQYVNGRAGCPVEVTFAVKLHLLLESPWDRNPGPLNVLSAPSRMLH